MVWVSLRMERTSDEFEYVFMTGVLNTVMNDLFSGRGGVL